MPVVIYCGVSPNMWGNEWLGRGLLSLSFFSSLAERYWIFVKPLAKISSSIHADYILSEIWPGINVQHLSVT